MKRNIPTRIAGVLISQYSELNVLTGSLTKLTNHKTITLQDIEYSMTKYFASTHPTLLLAWLYDK